MLRRTDIARRTIALEQSDEPPTEFCLFKAGVNDSTQGPAIFDAKAAKLVMAAYEKQGVDLMIDLEHLSTDPEAKNYDPDARGWARVELRGQELWAVDVRWTPDGEARLREKRQRYISPFFRFDKKAGRVVELINVALTGLPATHHAPPLVAASRSATTMDASMIKAALEAVKNEDSAKALELLEGMLVSAAGGGAGDDSAGDPPAEEPPAGDQANNEPPAPPAEDEDKDAAMAAATRLTRITGKATLGAAVDEVEVWRTSHVELEKRSADLAKERESLEANERDALTAEVAKVNGPAVAWSDPVKATDRAKRKPAEPYASMPIVSLRKHVEALKVTRSKDPRAGTKLTPPAVDEGGDHGLSQRELDLCKRNKIDPAKYAETRAGIRARSQTSTAATG